ncbi:hypothetical protein NDU88_000252 [Pleurodeles waltl]|uniref:Uncharacterized protein n=1 Tax=Pleurodeles waltl TaxID=8319 RepID=A0AAV7LE39_PLEWA|nr:hypothetical protein NDU88_000252 [Pleurodeles waltl]
MERYPGGMREMWKKSSHRSAESRRDEIRKRTVTRGYLYETCQNSKPTVTDNMHKNRSHGWTLSSWKVYPLPRLCKG